MGYLTNKIKNSYIFFKFKVLIFDSLIPFIATEGFLFVFSSINDLLLEPKWEKFCSLSPSLINEWALLWQNSRDAAHCKLLCSENPKN